MYSAYCTLEIILCLWHLKEPCAYGTSKNIVHIAPKNNTLCLWHLKDLCAYGTSKIICAYAPQK